MDPSSLIIVVVALTAGTIMVTSVVKSVLRYLSTKSQASQPASSMTSSELTDVIRGAVAEATQPLSERIEQLGQQLDSQKQLTSSARHDLLESVDDYEPEAANASLAAQRPLR